MILYLRILIFSLPVLYANITYTCLQNDIPKDLSLEEEYKQYNAAYEAYQEKYKKYEAKILENKKKYKERASTIKVTEYQTLEKDMKEVKDLRKEITADLEALNKRRLIIEEKRKSSINSWIDKHPKEMKEYTRNYDLHTVKKTLVIHNNPLLYMQSIADGGPILTGYSVWQSAEVIARYLDESCVKNSWIRGKKVLDLGAGTGYLGLVAACLGGDVTAADIIGQLPLLKKNIDANLSQLKGTGGKICSQVLRWGNSEDIQWLSKQDVILLSAVFYDQQAMESLMSTVVSLSKQGTVLVACQEKWANKTIWNSFRTEASKHFKFYPISLDGQDIPGDVWLIRGEFQ